MMRKPLFAQLILLATLTGLAACAEQHEPSWYAEQPAGSIDASAIGLNESGSVDTEENAAREQGKHLRLSDAAQVMFEKVVSSLKQIQSDREKICSHDKALQEKIAGELKTIHSDNSLSDAEKRSRIQALFASFKADMEAAQAQFMKCSSENRESLLALDRKGMAIAESCGLTAAPKARPVPPVQQQPQSEAAKPEPAAASARPAPLSVEQLEAGLTSEACKVLVSP